MQTDFEKELKEIMGDLECHKDFSCYKQGFKNLCKGKDVGLSSHLVCCEKDPTVCLFAWDLGSVFYCSCPVRVRIAKKLGK